MPSFINPNPNNGNNNNMAPPSSNNGVRPSTAESYGRPASSVRSGNSVYANSVATGGSTRLPPNFQPGMDGYYQSSAWSDTTASSRPQTRQSQGQGSSRGELSPDAGQSQGSGHVRQDWLSHAPQLQAQPQTRRAFWQSNTDGTAAHDQLGRPIWVVQEYVPNGQGIRSWVTQYYTEQAATDAGEFHRGTTASR